MKRINLTTEWVDEIDEHLKAQIEKVDPTEGWWTDDQRFDHEFGVSGKVVQNYDSARHEPVESVLLPLRALPITYIDGEPIQTVRELMEALQLLIIEEFPHLECENCPYLRLVAGYKVINDYGARIHSTPARFLEVSFEFEPVIKSHAPRR